MIRRAVNLAFSARHAWRGYKQHSGNHLPDCAMSAPAKNRLSEYFDAHRQGHGIWKWRHYFDIYERHLRIFAGKPCNLLEIGVYSGGSLEMWRSYVGDQCQIYGVDIAPECKTYEREGINITIGDQGDPAFWSRFRQEVPPMDIIIDDGSHIAAHQIISLEGLLPHLKPGGIYLCEDVFGLANEFISYMQGFARHLNIAGITDNPTDPERRQVSPANRVQSEIAGVFFYPFMVAIEKREQPVMELVAPKHGSQWQPFL